MEEPRVETTTAPGRPLAVVRVQATRTQRMWWFHLALFGSLSVAGMVGIIYEWGPEAGLLPAIVWPGLLVSIGAFLSGGSCDSAGPRRPRSYLSPPRVCSPFTSQPVRPVDPLWVPSD